MGEFSHFDQHGNAVMVDVTEKRNNKNCDRTGKDQSQ